MKIAWLTIIALVGLSIHYGYAETIKEQSEQKIKLIDCFRRMAAKTREIFVPRVKPVIGVRVTKDYDVRQHSIIASARLDQFLGGVLKNKGQKFIEEARKNNICPIFFAAICMHESANGGSKFSREKNNVFGIFKNGKYHSFESVDECIEFTGKLLGGRLYAGGKNHTIHKIQKIYCPVGADNDPRGLNKYWLDGVMSKMKKLWGEEVFVVDN